MLYLAGFTFETAFKLLIILTILLYAIGMYLLARDLFQSVYDPVTGQRLTTWMVRILLNCRNSQ